MFLGIEAVRQQLGKGIGFIAVPVTCHIHHKILIAKFPQHLPADSARRTATGDHTAFSSADCDSRKLPVAIIHRLKHSSPFRAIGRTIGCIFNITPLIHTSILTQKRRTHLKTGLGCVGMGHRFFCLGNQHFRCHISPP